MTDKDRDYEMKAKTEREREWNIDKMQTVNVNKVMR